jgi:hypothetical protein
VEYLLPELHADARQEDPMQVLYPRCCALDVHKATVVACVVGGVLMTLLTASDGSFEKQSSSIKDNQTIKEASVGPSSVTSHGFP